MFCKQQYNTQHTKQINKYARVNQTHLQESALCEWYGCLYTDTEIHTEKESAQKDHSQKVYITTLRLVMHSRVDSCLLLSPSFSTKTTPKLLLGT